MRTQFSTLGNCDELFWQFKNYKTTTMVMKKTIYSRQTVPLPCNALRPLPSSVSSISDSVCIVLNHP